MNNDENILHHTPNEARIKEIQKILDNDDAWLGEECAGSPHHGSMCRDDRVKLEQELRELNRNH